MSNTTKINAIDFLNEKNIKWFPIKINDKKEPEYTADYMPKQTDFKNLSNDEIIKRQSHINNYDFIAIDTSIVGHIDIDMVDSKLYKKDNYHFIKDMISKLPYYRSLSVNKGKKQGKHIFFTNEFQFPKKRIQTIFQDIEILKGQWGWIRKEQEVVIPNGFTTLLLKNLEKYTQYAPVKEKKEKKEKKIKIVKQKEIVITKDMKIKPNKNDEINELANIIDIEYLDKYDDWLRIMWCLKFISEDLKETAINISKKSSKYSEEGFNKIWNGKIDYVGITKATIYYYAKKSNIIEFKKIIRNYHLDNTDNNYAETFIKYQAENLVFKKGIPYIFIKNTWYKQDKEYNQLQAIITKVISEIICDILVELTLQLSEENKKENPNKNLIKLLSLNINDKRMMLKGVRSATGSKNICKKVIHNLSIMDFENVEFDNCPDILPFKTQYFNLENGKLKYYKANNYILTKLSYDYEEATQEKFDLIDDLFKKIFTNPDIRNDYKNILSTTLFGRPVDKFIIANGDGGNGKSVLHELLIDALEEGTFAYVAPVNVILNKIKQGNNPEVANMDNKRFVVYREPSENELINIGTLKELTGSKTINARMNYSNDTKTTLKATHILEANKKPKMKGEMDNAIYRRLVDIAFSSTFTFDDELIQENPETHFKADGYLRTQQFKDEYKIALIDYLIKHIQNYNKKEELKIYDPVKVSEATQQRTKQYIASSDFVLTFVKDNVVKCDNPKEYIKLKDLHSKLIVSEDYSNMSKDEKRKYNLKYFKQSISKNGLFKKNYKADFRYYNEDKIQKRVREVLVGYKMLTDDDEEDEEDLD